MVNENKRESSNTGIENDMLVFSLFFKASSTKNFCDGFKFYFSYE